MVGKIVWLDVRCLDAKAFEDCFAFDRERVLVTSEVVKLLPPPPMTEHERSLMAENELQALGYDMDPDLLPLPASLKDAGHLMRGPCGDLFTPDIEELHAVLGDALERLKLEVPTRQAVHDAVIGDGGAWYLATAAGADGEARGHDIGEARGRELGAKLRQSEAANARHAPMKALREYATTWVADNCPSQNKDDQAHDFVAHLIRDKGWCEAGDSVGAAINRDGTLRASPHTVRRWLKVRKSNAK